MALLTRATFTTDVLEGNTAVAGIFVAAGFAVWGWITRDRLGRLMLIAFVFALLTIITYGIWQSGFPEPSELRPVDGR